MKVECRRMSYCHLKQNEYVIGDYAVQSLRQEDMPHIKRWRNEQMDVLRQPKPLTDQEQYRYYNDIVVPSYNDPVTKIMLFSYFCQGTLIGYGGLTNLDWNSRRAEISFLLDTERSDRANHPDYAEDFAHFLKLMKRIAFEELGLNRLFTETYAFRSVHIGILEHNGFRPEGRMVQHVFIDGAYVDSLLHGCLKESYNVQE